MADKSERAEKEEKILQFWKENKIFEKTLEKPSPKGEFVFYEGPPTANGRPGIHHMEARAFKDAIPRYKTMQGYHVRRKAGWDTHGLPVELEVEKTLGLKSKKEIEEYGVAKFNEECKKSVWKYVDEWREFTDRIGYWVDMDSPYVTYHNSYMEKVWSVFKHTDRKGLLYKDYKVVPWCPRCGTALSSHELAQGYKDVKELSLYVKFKIKSPSTSSGQTNMMYMLVWTTTPWTLPGNVALAVGKSIEYVKVKVKDEFLMLAKSKLSILEEGYEIVEELKGKDLVGLEYEPIYKFLQDDTGKAFKVYPADFVNTEDGTGIVHTAVMYGQDDFELGTKVGLPKKHLVDESGHFMDGTDFLSGKFVKDESTTVEIIKDLAHRNLLFKKEKHEHSYPHCWRCKTPLIYYARDSWYIEMSKLRSKLIAENKKINWEPEYIKEGRFGEWLREVKDWAISRERYWGTPLPIWQNEDSSKRIVVDSLDTLKKHTKKSGNKYFIMRHAVTEGNGSSIVSYGKEAEDHITEEGRKQAETSAKKLKGKKIDMIISSPFVRTSETAEIVREILGLTKEYLRMDDRLKEMNPGAFDGKSWYDLHNYLHDAKEGWFNRPVEGGESFKSIGKRVADLLYELESKHKDKNILIVTHGAPAWLAYVIAGLYEPVHKAYKKDDGKVFFSEFNKFDNAEVRELDFVPLPHNEEYELDLHKPYIDEVILEKGGEEYKRVKEVLDVWFDSGSVPFASFEDVHERRLYPADFISEAIDQTRGWFYTLHAIGTLMDKGMAYKNVICLGHILDKEGKKMSKSIGNTVDPWEEIKKHGTDALRMWMYSVNQPGEAKNYDSETVGEINRRTFNILDNVLAFYELYRDKTLEIGELETSKDVLDKWILAKLSKLVGLSTSNLDKYKLLEPVRETREFIDDLSTWYLRRSRERIKSGDRGSKQTLYLVLKELSKLLAPFAPFYAEDLYQKLRGDSDEKSVHMESWPQERSASARQAQRLLDDMVETRRITSLGLEARSKANIKVRQPLSELQIKNKELGEEFLELIQEELNVKKVTVDKDIEEGVKLDTVITPKLEEEGRVREEIRKIQDWRREQGLKPGDKAQYEVPEESKDLFQKHKDEIKRATDVDF